MLTRYETQKLKRDMSRELEAGPPAVWGCAAGLAIIAALSLFGEVTTAVLPGEVAADYQRHQPAYVTDARRLREERRAALNKAPFAPAVLNPLEDAPAEGLGKPADEDDKQKPTRL